MSENENEQEQTNSETAYIIGLSPKGYAYREQLRAEIAEEEIRRMIWLLFAISLLVSVAMCVATCYYLKYNIYKEINDAIPDKISAMVERTFAPTEAFTCFRRSSICSSFRCSSFTSTASISRYSSPSLDKPERYLGILSCPPSEDVPSGKNLVSCSTRVEYTKHFALSRSQSKLSDLIASNLPKSTISIGLAK